MYPTDQRVSASPPRTIVIASEAKQSRAIYATLDCFASLAMTRVLSSATSFIGKITCHYDYHSYYRVQEESRSCRSEEHTSELQSLMRISYAVFCLKKKNIQKNNIHNT